MLIGCSIVTMQFLSSTNAVLYSLLLISIIFGAWRGITLNATIDIISRSVSIRLTSLSTPPTLIYYYLLLLAATLLCNGLYTLWLRVGYRNR